MKELIVIISDGPMGSTTIASIISNFGYLTFPLRHLGINKYLSRNYQLNNPFFINRVIENIEAYTIKRKTGGRGVYDEKVDHVLLDKKIKEQIIDLKKNKFSSFAEMYNYVYEMFNNYCIYKDPLKNYKGIIELSTDCHNYNPSEISKFYKLNFKNVRFISLTRDFKNWLNSISSQRFVTEKYKLKYFIIKLSSQIKRYNKYNNFINKLESNKIIQFEKIFEKNFLQDFLNYMNVDPKENIQDLKFDHYGKMLTYNETFELIDDKYYFLSKRSFKIIDYALKFNNNNFLKFLFDIFFQFSYILDFLRYILKKKPKKR